VLGRSTVKLSPPRKKRNFVCGKLTKSFPFFFLNKKHCEYPFYKTAALYFSPFSKGHWCEMYNKRERWWSSLWIKKKRGPYHQSKHFSCFLEIWSGLWICFIDWSFFFPFLDAGGNHVYNIAEGEHVLFTYYIRQRDLLLLILIYSNHASRRVKKNTDILNFFIFSYIFSTLIE
jgi:hypothetical protein